MKIEIDVNDTAGLKALETELAKWLGMVRFALSGTATPQPVALRTIILEDVNESDKRVAEVVKKAEGRFTSAFVRDQIGDSLTRAAVNAALVRAEQHGQIRTVQRGMGRRPATFEKVAAS
jgi:hypothetical protein